MPECPKRKQSYSSIFRCELSVSGRVGPAERAGILEAVEPYAPAIRALRAGDVTDKKSRSKVIRKYIHVHFLYLPNLKDVFELRSECKSMQKGTHIYIYNPMYSM